MKSGQAEAMAPWRWTVGGLKETAWIGSERKLFDRASVFIVMGYAAVKGARGVVMGKPSDLHGYVILGIHRVRIG